MGKYNLFIDILHRLHVKHITETSLQFFEQHPNKDNMYGLSEMLRSYQIETLGVMLPAREEFLRQLECPFVAYADHELVLVSQLTQDTVTYIWNGKDITLHYSDFINQWSGAILGFEASKDSIEPDYNSKRREQLLNKLAKTVLMASILAAWFCLFFIQPFQWSFSIIAVLFSIMGVFVSYLLVQKQVTGASEYGDRICSLLLHAKDCNKVLDSEYSEFFGISLSSIGLGYFLCNLLLFLDSRNMGCMLLVSILSLAFTFWSLWTQKFRVKQWCTLCLLILVCLWVNTLTFWLSHKADFTTIQPLRLIGVGCLYLSFMLAIHFYVKSRKDIGELAKVKRQYNSVRMNETVFEALLEQQKQYSVDKSIGLLIGNKNAENCITIVSNPHCSPCARLHNNIEKLYHRSGQNLCIQFILTSFNKELEASAMLLIQQYQQLNNDIKFLDLLTEWYAKGKSDKEAFYQQYKLNRSDEIMLTQYAKQKRWIQQIHITTTPTVLINGRLMPKQYELEDISYFTLSPHD